MLTETASLLLCRNSVVYKIEPELKKTNRKLIKNTISYTVSTFNKESTWPFFPPGTYLAFLLRQFALIGHTYILHKCSWILTMRNIKSVNLVNYELQKFLKGIKSWYKSFAMCIYVLMYITWHRKRIKVEEQKLKDD